MRDINNLINENFESILSWINEEKLKSSPLLYASIDIRESTFKIASIDTNLFPAGFNNLNKKNKNLIQLSITNFINSNYSKTRNILLFCEDHTRNTFYLENIFNLSNLIENAGFKVTIGSFFNDHPHVCNTTGFLKLKTALDNEVTLYCLNYILKNSDKFNFDLCLLNNDLSDGNYEQLNKLNIPILPDPKMGWHNRKKSSHIHELNKITEKLVSDCNLAIDPWQLSTLFEPIQAININNENDRNRIAEAANDLLNKIKLKYKQHKIESTPYLVLKSDNGTYGMGVLSINDPYEILNLNRKRRNKLLRGKSSQPIENLIIQEGIPSAKIINNIASEEVIYLVNGDTVGGFYRMHETKTAKDILNSKGMQFKAFNTSIDQHFSKPNENIDNYGISKTSYVIAQLANISAQKELSLI